jgi:hypothetical protein
MELVNWLIFLAKLKLKIKISELIEENFGRTVLWHVLEICKVIQ